MANTPVGNLHPIGTINIQQQKNKAPKSVIMTDHGWRPCDGEFYNRRVYPRLWDALPERRRGELVRVPHLSPDGKPYGSVVHLTPPQSFPPHMHTIAPPTEYDHLALNYMEYTVSGPEGLTGQWHSHNPKFDRSLFKPIGRTTRVHRDEVGLQVDFKLSDYFTAELKKAIVSTADVRRALGLETDMDLFPDITAPRGGLKFDTSNNKENNMPTRTLKTPAENIERKDLTVALRLAGNARLQDELYDVIALVQEVGDNESVYRLSEIKAEDVLGKNVRLHGHDASGLCSDFNQDDYSGKYNIVIAGKLEQHSDVFLIVTDEDPEPLGNDTLALVKD